MSNNAFYAQAYPPCRPQGEEGEWVWVPKSTTALPVLPLTPHQSPMYRSLSAESSQASPPAMPWTPSPVSPAYSPVGTGIPSAFESPVEPLLESFDLDMALNAYFWGYDPSWPAPAPVPDDTVSFADFLNTDMFLDSDFGFAADSVNPFAPTGIVTPPSSVYGTLAFADGSSPQLDPLTPASLPTANPSPASTSPAVAAQPLLPCPDASCTRVFPNPSDLRKHARKHRQPFRCPLPHCGKGHLDKRALARHLWAQHPDYAQRHNTRSERVKCTLCEYEGRADNVARHMKRHAK
ncbi:hypothetical protein NEMBOFW57_008553 [Staphylotrichum longicolle]|uniref:C2H2-type domain-containing protein n=1 Tax=Staphylotrichum longicolle TaxID=669026 RepID=A0AAD4HWR0_9PEZI|nr:hypothetical protein NEMBOFW57_008553 [Staphylotrichum longicolle]